MRLSTTLNDEIVKIFATILLPGLIGLAAFALFASWFAFASFKEASDAAYQTWLFSQQSPVVSTVLLFTLMVGTGITIENMGTRFEVAVCDRAGDREFENYQSIWRGYWKLVFENEPIGQKYLKYLVLHLKYELNVGCALSLFWIGVVLIDQKFGDIEISVLAYFLFLLLILWHFLEAKATSKNLHCVRNALVVQFGDDVRDNRQIEDLSTHLL